LHVSERAIQILNNVPRLDRGAKRQAALVTAPLSIANANIFVVEIK